mmetsp:Transcript_145626/g.271167  ORF Transcript_145626/g.271167 Transcript_145626/m.271167 type:complete len:437 (-) Transcript_145626:609-1919(-)
MSSELAKKHEKQVAHPEKRGHLRDDLTGDQIYLVLRRGVLRVRQTAHGPDTVSVLLAQDSSVALLADSRLEVRCSMPSVQKYIWAASTVCEAKSWFDAIQASIFALQSKVETCKQLLEDGCWMRTYNYSDSKRFRYYFWIANSGRELRWGRSKDEDCQKVDLHECTGLIYGPKTTTFRQCSTLPDASLQDASWCCFSLVFADYTLDLAVAGNFQIYAWYMGLQHLISQHGESSIPLMSDTQFLTLKVQMKLTDAAHEKGLILIRFLLESIRALSTRHGLMAATDPSGAVRSAGNKPETFHVSNGHSSSNPDSALFGSDTDSSSARTSFTFPPTSPSLAQVHSDNGAKDVSPEAIGDEVLFNATHTAKVSRIVHDAPRENVRTLYHATRESNALSICRMKQFLPGRNGFLGAGIYFCEDEKKMPDDIVSAALAQVQK